MSNILSQSLKERIRYVASYVESSTDDWIRVKTEIVKLFPPKERKLFSRRHYSTKKHTINDFEELVIAFWKNEVGVDLILYEKDKHPDDWVKRPSGWALQIINEQRKLFSKGSSNAKKKKRKKAKRRKASRDDNR
jgi:hypothetical protein